MAKINSTNQTITQSNSDIWKVISEFLDSNPGVPAVVYPLVALSLSKNSLQYNGEHWLTAKDGSKTKQYCLNNEEHNGHILEQMDCPGCWMVNNNLYQQGGKPQKASYYYFLPVAFEHKGNIMQAIYKISSPAFNNIVSTLAITGSSDDAGQTMIVVNKSQSKPIRYQQNCLPLSAGHKHYSAVQGLLATPQFDIDAVFPDTAARIAFYDKLFADSSKIEGIHHTQYLAWKATRPNLT